MSSDGDEVAEDYRLALEDLSSNMRFEISNLTVIARENTEHALAIAEVLQQHILKAPPNKKLPALYVMDSIVKNVGTPYTLYFGRTLFKIFMESYAVVDHGVRRKMEEMLKTWKDPVPGSMDTRPVFSHELVRPIENALMKARAASMPQQAQSAIPGRPRSAMFPHRNTPTPPGMRGYPGPAGNFPPQPHPFANGGHPGEPVAGYPGQQPAPYPPPSTLAPYNSTPASFPQAAQGPYGSGLPLPSGISVETLSSDIQNLIVAMRAEFSQNPHDSGAQSRLKALLDLQSVVQHSNLPPDQLELIKNKVTELAAVTIRATLGHSSANSTPIPAPAVPPAMALSVHPPSTSVTPSPVPAAQSAVPVTLDSLLGKGAMAALLSMQSSNSQQNTTPKPPFAGVPIRSPQMNHNEPPKAAAALAPPPSMPAAPASSASSLLDQLRAAGMLPPATPTNVPAPNQAPAVPVMPPSIFPSGLPASIASLLAAHKPDSGRSSADSLASSTGLDFAIKKQFRPESIAALYDDLGPPCTQCGRRFRTDEEGRRKKTAHMDWHFQVHQRSTEAEKRGTHRSWYVDQQDWLKAREAVDAIHDVSSKEESAQASKDSEGPKYILVPDPSSGINNVCPICQERFENKWLDTVQEWVWLDTILVGNRAYHASCRAEATRDRESTPVQSRRTPEPVLGKRKAETGLASPKIRVQKPFM
ncbi:hypothetical protein M441DRAFT_50607 [Trichoderma asperellum CBS 433.97]|uniref:CID domain-containing protein n=1 Tax=Trichoderma asperellum (strain ATCC 204424 / CBS 433.97 / NBRC 101777) TaxID=1042311 RepID=A0A2T3YXR8_TRIA4|nr:hypothetical protein M441DRAFT_50607 [Trichoderma asperellum CBS 433.97]PTB37342.1 hypothetical protein M441DRAFT_50607 [Trichoderma asperellum CBS 433.97]